MGIKRVGIELDESLWKEARKKSIDLDMSFADYVRNLIKADLEKDKKEE